MSKFEITIVQVTLKGEGDVKAAMGMVGSMLSQLLQGALSQEPEPPPAAITPRKRSPRSRPKGEQKVPPISQPGTIPNRPAGAGKQT